MRQNELHDLVANGFTIIALEWANEEFEVLTSEMNDTCLGEAIFEDSGKFSATRFQKAIDSQIPSKLAMRTLRGTPFTKNKLPTKPVVITSLGNAKKKYGKRAVKAKRKKTSEQVEHCDSGPPGSFINLPLDSVPIAMVIALENDTKLRVEGNMIDIPMGSACIFRGDLAHNGVEFNETNRRVHIYLDSTSESSQRLFDKDGADLTFFTNPEQRYAAIDGQVFQTFKELRQHIERK